MSDPVLQPWSNNPNAPQIPSWEYNWERNDFAGLLIGAISYGIVIVLFFQCMGVLFSPTNSMKKVIKWLLVVHTMAMFSFSTIPFGILFNWAPVKYINDREFPGVDKLYPPGPFGYDDILHTGTLNLVYKVMFPLNQWLADGLLLHRCYVIYSMNHWVMTFPYPIYLASVAMGITQLYETAWPGTIFSDSYFSYFSISLGLNVLLTLMIVTRLIWHRRKFQGVLGASYGSSGPYKAIVTMIIESYALYAVALLAYTIAWAILAQTFNIFAGPARSTQVIAPYLIIIRVAKRRAVTSESISGSFESMRFRSQGSMNGDGSLLDGDPTNAMEVNGEGLGAREEVAIEEVPL